MDDLDRKLITALEADARQPLASLAIALGVTRTTVRARLERLRRDGVIQGFSVVIARPDDDRIRAITMVEVEGKSAERVIRQLLGFPEIRALHATNGRWDIVAELEVATLPEFDATLRRMREVDGIASTETSLLLATRKSRPVGA